MQSNGNKGGYINWGPLLLMIVVNAIILPWVYRSVTWGFILPCEIVAVDEVVVSKIKTSGTTDLIESINMLVDVMLLENDFHVSDSATVQVTRYINHTSYSFSKLYVELTGKELACLVYPSRIFPISGVSIQYYNKSLTNITDYTFIPREVTEPSRLLLAILIPILLTIDFIILMGLKDWLPHFFIDNQDDKETPLIEDRIKKINKRFD